MVLDAEVTTRIFDFDGTLFRLPVDYQALRRDLGQPATAKIGQLLQRFLDEGDEEGLAVVTRHELAAVPAGSFIPGALDAVRASGNVAVLTRNSRHAVTAALGELAEGIHIVGREDVRRLKPDPEGLKMILDWFHVKPAGAVMIGDTYHDVDAARALSVRCVVVRNPRLDFEPEGAEAYLADLTEL